MYPAELQLYKTNSSATEAPFLCPNFKEVERGHTCLGLSVRASVCVSATFYIRSRTVRDRMLKFDTWNKHEK